LVDIEIISTFDKQINRIMKTLKMSVRQIRRILFETDKFTVIGADEMTNKESRDYLYGYMNQDYTFLNVIDNGSHLLIWE
jgi:ethanolamine utilization microcompartment shell protein EutL